MRIDVDRQEFEAIVDGLKGQLTKAQAGLARQLARRLDWQLHPSKAPDKNGWAPIRQVSIRSSWPSGIEKQSHKPHWSYQRGRKAKVSKAKTPTKPKTADDILAEI